MDGWRELIGNTGPRHKPRKLTESFGIRDGQLEFDIVTGNADAARGHSAGALAWDEVLTQDDWDGYAALSETQSAQTNPILLMTSTAGFANSVVLRTFYDRLKRIATGDEKPDPTFYGAWWESEDPDAGLDWRQIAQANPGIRDGRLSKDFIASRYAILPAEKWKRERLNHWVDVVADSSFAPGVWARTKQADALTDADPPFTLGIDIQPGWERASIVAAAIRPDGRIGAEVYRDIRADDGQITAQTIIDAVQAFPDPVYEVVYEATSGAAGEFARYALTTWGQEWRALKPHEVVAACMDAKAMVLSGRLAVDDPLLDAQVPNVAERAVGQDGAFRFSRRLSTGPIDTFMALTFAVHAAASQAPPPSIT
jgi:phage terminase large subunit-like protein